MIEEKEVGVRGSSLICGLEKMLKSSEVLGLRDCSRVDYVFEARDNDGYCSAWIGTDLYCRMNERKITIKIR